MDYNCLTILCSVNDVRTYHQLLAKPNLDFKKAFKMAVAMESDKQRCFWHAESSSSELHATRPGERPSTCRCTESSTLIRNRRACPNTRRHSSIIRKITISSVNSIGLSGTKCCPVKTQYDVAVVPIKIQPMKNVWLPLVEECSPVSTEWLLVIEVTSYHLTTRLGSTPEKNYMRHTWVYEGWNIGSQILWSPNMDTYRKKIGTLMNSQETTAIYSTCHYGQSPAELVLSSTQRHRFNLLYPDTKITVVEL